MMNPTVTVLISVYNGERYLADSIDSILQQSYKDFELLIIDDGSTDRSADIVESYIDDRIHFLKNDKNRGLPFTRNLAIAEAKGAFLALLDADDISLPGRLEKQVEYLEAHPEVVLCGSQALLIDSDGQETGEYYGVPVDSEEIKILLAFHNVFINSTRMYRLSILRKTNGYYPGLCEDYEMAIQLNEHYVLANLDEVLVKYRVHGSSITNAFPEKMRQAEKYVVSCIHKQLGIDDDQELVSTHHAVFMGYSKQNLCSIADYEKLFSTLKEANQKKKIYPNPSFNKLLFAMWYDKIREVGKRKALLLFFRKPLFEWECVTFKMLRKVFKQTFWR